MPRFPLASWATLLTLVHLPQALAATPTPPKPAGACPVGATQPGAPAPAAPPVQAGSAPPNPGCPATPQAQNQQVLQAWSQAVGAPAPALVPQGDGQSRLDWQLQIGVDAYRTDIDQPAAQAVYSPNASGDYHRSQASFQVQSLGADGQRWFAQGNLLASNDRSVIARYSDQLMSLQIGGSGASYQWSAGDVATAYSLLSTNLGLRGFAGQWRAGAWSVQGHLGTLAESWEALAQRTPLDGRPARSSYLRDVQGLKLQYEGWTGWQLYLTHQSYEDQDGSQGEAQVWMAPAEARSMTVGLSYQAPELQAQLETGRSRFQEKAAEARTGQATLLNLNGRLGGQNGSGGLAWRLGANDVAAHYSSLGAMATPGLKEVSTGFDWQPEPWLSLGGDARAGKQRTAATAWSDATSTPFESLLLRGNVMLNEWLQGLSLQAQDMRTWQDSGVAADRSLVHTQLSLNLAQGNWFAMAGLTRSTMKDPVNAWGNSRAPGWMMSLSRNWSGEPGVDAWSLSTQLMLNGQRQDSAGQRSSSQSGSFAVTGQHPRWGQLSLNLQAGSFTLPSGQELQQRAYVLDASHPLTRQSALRIYWRLNERNLGQADLATREQTGGLQLSLTL
ncbi:hypothetical protein HNQ51_000155 [Inhella inkyongensis]|uniref:Uncharacterized protein n=1 Tax=Inhella inkyongensis TaxID=392593 RepID=A0A840S036_9BURK|nr:hypothetical protein [Inhella inkyongensis]MBB5202862.1 hypothetical protein [Inhella inkyongensis]